VTRAYRRPTWWDDPRLRVPLLLAGLLGGVGGLLVALGTYRSGATRTDDIGDVFSSGFTWFGIVVVLVSTAAHLAVYVWAKRHPPASTNRPGIST
jgi:hypothetical protein